MWTVEDLRISTLNNNNNSDLSVYLTPSSQIIREQVFCIVETLPDCKYLRYNNKDISELITKTHVHNAQYPMLEVLSPDKSNRNTLISVSTTFPME